MHHSSKGLIITVGTSEAPIIYSLQQIKPSYAAFIYTSGSQGSRSTLDKVLNEYPINSSCLNERSVRDDPDQIGKLVKAFYELFCWLKDDQMIDPSDIYTDPTPGRKWMSAGTTMIASFLNLQMFYTDAKYIGGKLDPSTMNLISLGNAYDQTGFLESEEGRELFNKFEFLASSEVFSKIRPILSDHSDLYIGLSRLSKLLHRWELFDHYHQSLKKEFDDALLYLKRYSYSADREFAEINQFYTQMKTLAERVEEITNSPKPTLLATFDLFFNAKRRFSQGRYDDAMARCYRALESLSQFYLSRDFGIDASTPDYSKISDEQQQNIRDKLKNLPSKLALEDGWKILWVLQHFAGKEVIREDKKGNLSNLLSGILDERNYSILAHGWKPVTQDRAKKMLDKMASLLIKLECEYFERVKADLQPPEMPTIWKF